MGFIERLLAVFRNPLSKHMADLESTDCDIRIGAVQSIGYLARDGKDATKAIPMLMDLASRDPHAAVRSYALNAINPMLQKKYSHRPIIAPKFVIQMAMCLISEHSDAEDVNKVFYTQRTHLEDIRDNAAANLIAIGKESLDAIAACAQQDPKGAQSAKKEIDYIRANLGRR